MKPGMLCLLLLSGCFFSDERIVRNYVLTWTCLSREGCERMEEVARIDRMERVRFDCELTSTQDESFVAVAKTIDTESLPPGCIWLDFLTLFGHELERSRFCDVPGGFELEVAIPNEDPTTSSMWLVEGRDVKFL